MPANSTVSSPLMVAYFSMEVCLDPPLPTYSGGLGVLAGDTLRAAADLGIAMVGVTLLHRQGYFRQSLDAQGNQIESPATWSPQDFLEPLPPRATIVIEGRQVQLRAWRCLVPGVNGHSVPVYFLDTCLPENDLYDQTLTDHLYVGDSRYRLCQEAVLGLGGVAMLRALGYESIQVYHMNEGHSALLALALLEERRNGRGAYAITQEDREAVRQQCVFTTHTPMPAGHDRFPLELVRQVLGDERASLLEASGCCLDATLNMTHLGLASSRYVNGVAMRHGEVSQSMFPNYRINSITNGVHAATWAAAPFHRLYDRHMPEWRRDSLYLRYAVSVPLEEIQQAHIEAKGELLAEVERRTGVRLNPAVMTIGFARRVAAYKRGDLLFADLERLKRIALNVGPLQVIYGGKAHPQDVDGKAIIRRVFEAAAALAEHVPVVYLEEYDAPLAKYVCSGVDLWLNTPQKRAEASGTSGMKAAVNGVPSLSVLDGWWLEGHVEGVTGWAIGDSRGTDGDSVAEAASLYDKLEHVVLPLFYGRRTDFVEVMRSSIALNASFFNAQRMLFQYFKNAYLVASKPP